MTASHISPRRSSRGLLGPFIAGMTVFALAVVAGWGLAPLPAMAAASGALQSDAEVSVEIGHWIVFSPAAGVPAAGLIVYPGARVDPVAYAPIAHAIAREGYLVVIVPMPLNLAIAAPDSAADVIVAFPRTHTWALAGHSLGGAMAARFAFTHPAAVRGLALWAAYPAADNSLAARPDLIVTSIYGTRDGLATPDKIEVSRALLPRSTSWVAIDGGNHAQFGSYGSQAGDNLATIGRSEQQAQVVAATVDLLDSIAKR